VQQAFYHALATQQTVAVRRQMVQLAGDSVETAHQLANLGQADAPDVLQALLTIAGPRQPSPGAGADHPGTAKDGSGALRRRLAPVPRDRS